MQLSPVGTAQRAGGRSGGDDEGVEHPARDLLVAVDHVVRLASGVALLVSQPLQYGLGTPLPPGSAVTVSWDAAACMMLPE